MWEKLTKLFNCIWLILLFPSIVSAQQIDSIEQFLNNTISTGLNLYNKDPDSTITISKNAYQIAISHDYPLLAAELLRIQGMGVYNKVDYARALSLFTESKDIFVQYNDLAGEARALNSISVVYNIQGLYEKSLEMDKIILAMRMEIGDSSQIAGSFNNIAVSLQRMGNLNEALSNYLKALQIARIINDRSSLGLYYNNIGNTYLQKNNFDSAKHYYNKSKAISRQLGNLQIESNALNYLGELYYLLGQYSKSINYSLKSLKIAKSIGITFEIEDVAKNLYKSYEALGDYKNAFKYHKLFKEMADSANNDQTMQQIAQIEALQEFENERQLQKILQEKANIESFLEIQKHKQARNLAYLTLVMSLILAIVLFLNFKRKLAQNKILKEQKAEIEIQRDQISALNKTKDKFFAIIAHDLKNPLSGLHRLAEITLQYYHENSTEQNIENIMLLAKGAEKTYTLLENLLSWAQLQLGAIKPQFVTINLSDNIQQIVNLLQSNAHQKNINLNFEHCECIAFTDQLMFNTIIRNLVSNAIKFTPQYGEVTISIVGNSKEWQIMVKDSGIGLSDEDQKILFDNNTDKSEIGNSREKGTGLGLTLCYEFSQLLKSPLTVKSSLNEGSVFTLYIPKSQQTVK